MLSKMFKTLKKIDKVLERINSYDFEVNVADRATSENMNELASAKTEYAKLIKKLRKQCEKWLENQT